MVIETNVTEVIRNLEGFKADLEEVRLSGARKVAFEMKRKVERNARLSGISGMRLSGVGRSGARLGVKVDRQRDGQYLVKGTGPWQLVEGDTKAHSLRPRRGRRAVLRTPGGPRASWGRAQFQHGGTRGKRIWRRSFAQNRDEALDTYRTGVQNAMRRRYG